MQLLRARAFQKVGLYRNRVYVYIAYGLNIFDVDASPAKVNIFTYKWTCTLFSYLVLAYILFYIVQRSQQEGFWSVTDLMLLSLGISKMLKIVISTLLVLHGLPLVCGISPDSQNTCNDLSEKCNEAINSLVDKKLKGEFSGSCTPVNVGLPFYEVYMNYLRIIPSSLLTATRWSNLGYLKPHIPNRDFSTMNKAAMLVSEISPSRSIDCNKRSPAAPWVGPGTRIRILRMNS